MIQGTPELTELGCCTCTLMRSHSELRGESFQILLYAGCTLVLGYICRDWRTHSDVRPCLPCYLRDGCHLLLLHSGLAEESLVSAHHLTEEYWDCKPAATSGFMWSLGLRTQVLVFVWTAICLPSHLLKSCKSWWSTGRCLCPGHRVMLLWGTLARIWTPAISITFRLKLWASDFPC